MTTETNAVGIKADFERKRIVEHAGKVFQQRGYDGTTMDHIAKEMQVTKGFIYYYFKSKAEVFFKLHSRAIDEARAFISSEIPADADPQTKLERAIHAHVHLTIQRPTFGGVASRTAWTVNSPKFPSHYRDILNEQRASLLQIYENIIREGVDAGVFHAVKARLLIRMIMGAVTWMSTWYRADGRSTPDEIAEVLALMTRGPLQLANTSAPGSRQDGRGSHDKSRA